LKRCDFTHFLGWFWHFLLKIGRDHSSKCFWLTDWLIEVHFLFFFFISRDLKAQMPYPLGIKIFFIRKPFVYNANLLILNWFYKRLFFFFYLTTEILRSSLLLRIFECGFWNKKCALTCQETLFWTVRRCEEKWAQKSSFSVKKAQVWFGMIENLL
jgi:hypothetical protein